MPKKLTSKEVEKLAEEAAQKKIEQEYGWRFKERGGKGFDLLFEDAEGNKKYVEVKGRKGKFTNTFVDEPEWEFAKKHSNDHLFLFIVFGEKYTVKGYKVYSVKEFKEIKEGEGIKRPGFRERRDFQIYF